MHSITAKLRSSTLTALRISMPKPQIPASSPIPSMVMFMWVVLFLPFICKPSALLPKLSISLSLMVPTIRMATGRVSSPFW